MLSEEALRGGAVDQRFVEQPLDSPARGPGVAEVVPGLQEVWVFLVQLVIEPPERAAAVDRTGEPAVLLDRR